MVAARPDTDVATTTIMSTDYSYNLHPPPLDRYTGHGHGHTTWDFGIRPGEISYLVLVQCAGVQVGAMLWCGRHSRPVSSCRRHITVERASGTEPRQAPTHAATRMPSTISRQFLKILRKLMLTLPRQLETRQPD